MHRKISILFFLVLVLLPFSTANAAIIPVDLNDFYADPSYAVDIAFDGSSATMYEDLSVITVFLINDPSFGDPGIPVPDDLLTLNFDYSFSEGINNDDDFYAWVFDPDTYAVIDEFWVEDSDSGTISWDLSLIDPGITLLGLEFQLNSWDDLYDSSAEISNVYLETSSTPIPEPCTIALVGSGLFGLFAIRKKYFLKPS